MAINQAFSIENPFGNHDNIIYIYSPIISGILVGHSEDAGFQQDIAAGIAKQCRMGLFIVDEDRCLNYNYKKTECHNCRQICPRQCWDASGQRFPDRCDGCGLCQSVCPVDAIGVEGIPASGWKQLIGSAASDLHISCRSYGTGPWSCLGFLNARDWVFLAWPQPGKPARDVYAYLSHCPDCRGPVAKKLEQEIEAANQFLMKVNGGKIIQAKNQPPAIESQSMGRRSFFNSLAAVGIEAAKNVIWPEQEVEPLPKSRWRADSFHDRPEQDLKFVQTIFPVLSIDNTCIACGLCAKMCFIKALSAVEGESGLELYHEPLLCTGCGLCALHCPTGSIHLEGAGPAGKARKISQAFPRCNECGQLFKPAGQQLTCFDCLLKGRQNIFGP